MLEKEYEYFKKIRSALIKDHLNEFVVIKKEEILGFYPSFEQAIEDTSKNHQLGTFIVQKCVPKDLDVHRYHSRVIFS
jgi:hypothetical protein